jgi:hypothetical protein
MKHDFAEALPLFPVGPAQPVAGLAEREPQDVRHGIRVVRPPACAALRNSTPHGVSSSLPR